MFRWLTVHQSQSRRCKLAGIESQVVAAMILVMLPALSKASPPNILFLIADQMRFDAFAAGKNYSGHNAAPPHSVPSWTPNLDKLAGQGILFSKAYSSTPTCTPARAALLTGQSPWYHGMLGYGEIAHRYPFEMPRALAAAGYSTHSFGKDHFSWNQTSKSFDPYRHGYQTTNLYEGITTEMDDYHLWFREFSNVSPERAGWPSLDMNSWRGKAFALKNESLHPTKYVGDKAVQFLKSINKSAGPWFAKISFHRPHSPYDPPRRILDNISENDLPPVEVCGDSGEGWDAIFKKDSSCGPKNLDAWCGNMPIEARELARRAYRASVAFVDEQIGRIIDVLDTRDLLESTFVLFTSDHGDGQGDHYHWRKGYPYEFSSHVPMVLRWPDSMISHAGLNAAVRGQVDVSHVVALRDVFPTFLDVAGARSIRPRNYTFQGGSLLPLIDVKNAKELSWRPWLDMEHTTCYNATNHWNALSDGSIKYIFNAFSATEQLFNLTSDPYELVDISEDPAMSHELALWRQRLVRQFEQEDRGPKWVKDGKLQQRSASQTYSPNYPKNHY